MESWIQVIIKLTINKVSANREFRTSNFYESNETTLMQMSPMAAAQDAAMNPLQDIDNRLRTLQIQSRISQAQTKFRELQRTLRNLGRYIEGQYMVRRNIYKSTKSYITL